MTNRGIPSGMATQLLDPHISAFDLIEFQFTSGTQYVTTAGHAVDWNGHTWSSLLGVATVSQVVETDEIIAGITITLSHAKLTNVALAMTEDVQGRPIILRFAIVKPDKTLYVDSNVWQGKMDTLNITDKGINGEVVLSAESDMIDMQRPRSVRMSNEEQQRRNPGDKFFEFAATMANTSIVWPSKEYFKK